MSRKVTIALDAMGGDRGPDAVVPAALATLERDDSVELDARRLARRARAARSARRATATVLALGFKTATEVVSMDEAPADALRRKKDSSLRVAIELVKSGEADACVSSGNTGALMATARYVLKTLPGIDRPAIISAVPGSKARRTCSISAPMSVARREHLVAVRVDGLRRRRRHARHRAAARRAA